jgi:hypothetical protein
VPVSPTYASSSAAVFDSTTPSTKSDPDHSEKGVAVAGGEPSGESDRGFHLARIHVDGRGHAETERPSRRARSACEVGLHVLGRRKEARVLQDVIRTS